MYTDEATTPAAPETAPASDPAVQPSDMKQEAPPETK